MLKIAMMVLAVAALADGAAWAASTERDAEHQFQMPDRLSWQPAPQVLPPGAEIAVLQGNPAAQGGTFVMRAKLPAGYYVPPHSHPTDESLTIISGTMLYGRSGQEDKAQATALPVGTYIFLPGNHAHQVWADDEVVLEIKAEGPFDVTYVDPADDPRQEKAEVPK